MITCSNLTERLQEYQIHCKTDWSTGAFSSPGPASPSSSSTRVDVMLVIWEILAFACLVFTGVSLYFRYMEVAIAFLFVALLLLACTKITKQVRQHRKSVRRMLLPLSM